MEKRVQRLIDWVARLFSRERRITYARSLARREMERALRAQGHSRNYAKAVTAAHFRNSEGRQMLADVELRDVDTLAAGGEGQAVRRST